MEFPRLTESQSSGSSQIAESDRPIIPVRRQKRRRRSYIDPSLILQAFPQIEPDVLCKLSELKQVTPSEVLALVPNASSEDIADFFAKLKGSANISPAREQRNKSSSGHRGGSKPSLLDELKEDIEDAEDIRHNVRKYVKSLAGRVSLTPSCQD